MWNGYGSGCPRPAPRRHQPAAAGGHAGCLTLCYTRTTTSSRRTRSESATKCTRWCTNGHTSEPRAGCSTEPRGGVSATRRVTWPPCSIRTINCVPLWLHSVSTTTRARAYELTHLTAARQGLAARRYLSATLRPVRGHGALAHRLQRPDQRHLPRHHHLRLGGTVPTTPHGSEIRSHQHRVAHATERPEQHVTDTQPEREALHRIIAGCGVEGLERQ